MIYIKFIGFISNFFITITNKIRPMSRDIVIFLLLKNFSNIEFFWWIDLLLFLQAM